MKRKKRLLKALACGMALIMALSLAACQSGKSGNGESALSEFTYDVNEDPPATKNIVFVKGSWEEMGFQFGQQAKDAVQRNVASGYRVALDKYGSFDKAMKGVSKYTDVIQERAPELLALWKGMADGAELDYDKVLLSQISYNPEDEFCSTISIWGDKSASENLIAGVNSDGSSYGSVYMPAVVAFPDEGNAFIGYSGFVTNGLMNEKGLVVMSSQGQESGKGDIGYGIPTRAGGFHVAWSCDNAKQAKDTYIDEKLGPGTGENLHVSDIDGNAFVVEHTNDSDMVRTDKDFGNGSYTIATNGFLIEGMWDSLHKDDGFWDDCLPRYWTEEKIIQDNGAANTIDSINNALGCNSYYVDENWYSYVWDEENFIGYKEIENGVWEKDIWDISDRYTGFWTPENREPGTKCVMRGIMDPANQNMYVMSGCRDTNISVLPKGTGNFWRMTLGKNESDMTAHAKQYAQIQIYLGARDIDTALENGTDTAAREKSLAKAKSLLLKGIAYEDQAGCSEDKNERLMYMGKAASAYCAAQCYAQKAQDDPSKLIRDGEGYEVY